MSTKEDTCRFCGIAQGKIASQNIAESEAALAFLDTRPIRPGHAQIIPKAHFDYVENVPPEILSEVMGLAQAVARAMKRVYPVHRVAVVFSGTDIAHVHAHVVPMLEATDITSRLYIAEQNLTFRSVPKASDADLVTEAERLLAAM